MKSLEESRIFQVSVWFKNTSHLKRPPDTPCGKCKVNEGKPYQTTLTKSRKYRVKLCNECYEDVKEFRYET